MHRNSCTCNLNYQWIDVGGFFSVLSFLLRRFMTVVHSEVGSPVEAALTLLSGLPDERRTDQKKAEPLHSCSLTRAATV